MLPGNEREDLERGGKIIMPPSSLDWLSRMNVTYPMLFKLKNESMNRVSHCGVLEFIAEEGMVYLPNWMMRNLMLSEGDQVEVENTDLPVATFSKFRPESADFLDIYNPKAVLENSLRGFACLTTGDVISISYNERNYELSVLETGPGSAVAIIECDMNVEFAAPLGYKEAVMEEEEVPPPDSPLGYRLDGKERKPSTEWRAAIQKKGVPDYDWRVGTLVFMRKPKAKEPKQSPEETSSFQPFQGKGYTLRKQ